MTTLTSGHVDSHYCSRVRIVCHGILMPRKPSDALFRLYRDMSLVELRLHEVVFIFLLSSHTAVPNEESISDNEDLDLIVAGAILRILRCPWDDVGHGR